jgi:hypothetical protein
LTTLSAGLPAGVGLTTRRAGFLAGLRLAA